MKKKIVKTLKVTKEILWGNKRVRKDYKAEIYQNSSLIIISAVMGYNIPFLTGVAEFTDKALFIEVTMIIVLFMILIGVHYETKRKLKLQELADI